MALSDPAYEYKSNPYYKKFIKEKETIKKKYPPRIFYTPTSGKSTSKECKEYILSGDRELHQQYLKEVADLIFTPDGNYQQFTWDIMAEVDKQEMEKRARGRISGNGEYI